jgi:TetR/AcrR family transcriptional regulator, tetracycline repressor protein
VAPQTTASRPAAPRPWRRLDRERIVSTACAIADDEGPSAVTMRRLGAELGVDPTAVYHWFASKRDLQIAMADQYFSAILDVYRDDATWRENLAASARRGRRIYMLNPGLREALAMVPDVSPHLARVTERELTLLRSAGLSEQEAALAHHALDDLVTGSGLFLVVAPDLADPGERAGFRRYTAGLPADEYPTSVALAPYMFGDVDAVFEFQLELLFDGIEHRTANHKEP